MKIDFAMIRAHYVLLGEEMSCRVKVQNVCGCGGGGGSGLRLNPCSSVLVKASRCITH